MSYPISIHALREESDPGIWLSSYVSVIFLSTLSVRRATQSHTKKIIKNAFLSTLSVRRATDTHQAEYPELSISIHALRVESDLIFIGQLSQTSEFLSTLSVRRATFQ